MKASIVATLIVSGGIALAVTTEARQAEKTAPKEHTMTGCLQKGSAADTYVVMNTDPKGPKTIGIVESKDKLEPHVGHKIDITGVNVPAKEAESAKTKPPKADHYMKLSAIKMVSATCP